MYKVHVSSHTDIGDRKKTNQDSIFCKSEVINNRNVCMFIVADGCGGLLFGEEVSNLIVTYFSRFWNDELKNLVSAKKVDIREIDAVLNTALENVNRKAISFSNQVKVRVGSTVTMLVSVDNKYIIKNVGDSRVYLKRENKIVQLTEDQSLVADLVRSGELTKEEAKNYKKKNVLTMCVGAFEDLKVYSKKGKIKDNDVFILCSDGLHNCVSIETMLEVLKSRRYAFEEKAQVLRESIESGKANDNVSSILCGYYKKRRLHISSIVILAAVAALLVILFKDKIFDFITQLTMTGGAL